MTIDAKKYLEKKEAGLVTLAKVGDAAVISWKRFDPETGEKTIPIVEAVDLKNLKELKTQASDLVTGIELMIEEAKE